jgi:thioredoxin 1
MHTNLLGNSFLRVATGFLVILAAGCAGQGPAVDTSGVDSTTLITATVKITDANFQSVVLESPDLVMVDFWAEWCGPCQRIAPIVEEVAEEYAGRVVVGKMDVDENPATPGQFGIDGIPALLFFKDGKLVDSLTGLQPKAEIAKTLDTLLLAS